MNTYTKQQCQRLAKKYGGDWIDEMGGAEVLSPPGKVWSCDFIHGLVSVQWDGETMSRVWTDLYDRMSDGVEACPHEECDCCDEDRAAGVLTA